MNKKNIYGEGRLMLNNRPHLGDLVFRAYSKRPIHTELGRIVRNYPGVFGNKYVLMGVLGLFICVQVFVLHKLLGFLYKSLFQS